jgi:hypothetical protein
MVTLKLLASPQGPFPPLPTVTTIRNARISGAIEMAFLKENLHLAAHSMPTHRELHDALRASLMKYERRRLYKEVDGVFFGGILGRARRGSRDSLPGFRRIDTTPGY